VTPGSLFGEASDGPDPVVFVSHSNQDARFAHKLADDVTARGFYAWCDEVDMPLYMQDPRYKDNLAELHTNLGHGVLRSQIVIVVLTPSLMKSKWVPQELKVAAYAGKPLVPILREPCEVPLQDPKTLLEQLTGIPYESQTNPLSCISLPPCTEEVSEWGSCRPSGDWAGLLKRIISLRLRESCFYDDQTALMPDGYLSFLNNKEYEGSLDRLCMVISSLRK